MSDAREPVTITKVYFDHERPSWWFSCEAKGWGQGFGGIYFKPGSTEERAFLSELCELFGVDKVEDIAGRNCFVLRCFETPIEGFEVDGKRWTLTGFRRRHFPQHAKSRLEETREYYLNRIASAKRQIADAQRDLATVDSRFVDWEKPRTASAQVDEQEKP